MGGFAIIAHVFAPLKRKLYVMEELLDTSQLKAMKRFRKGARFIGFWFVFIGGFMLYQFLGILNDPEATITYNGVPTNEYSVKLDAAIFIGLFVVIGLLAAFSPSRWLNKLFVAKMSFKSAIGFKK
ncbi:conserved hypothetical protein [Alteromonas sp. 38]|uniref:hypothetical protein n=1 Tax=unclassified Alteromonas TaxID=2614992 RepID=UPI0012F0280A|nr:MULTISPECIES: hypothetical protein [unclassified Alteromonas]CAD5292409.1 conserved hypothetical protein [Alteromonas sp. 154]VXB14999.1 conserved hypothetical protein [Alteromonas sp. 38]